MAPKTVEGERDDFQQYREIDEKRNSRARKGVGSSLGWTHGGSRHKKIEETREFRQGTPKNDS